MRESEKPVTFFDHDGKPFDAPFKLVPEIGTGLYYGAEFYRVFDVWFNADASLRGPVPYGWIVQCVLTDSGDQPQMQLVSDFYRSRQKVEWPLPVRGNSQRL